MSSVFVCVLAGGMHKTHIGSEMQRFDWLGRVYACVSCRHGSGHFEGDASMLRWGARHHLRLQNSVVADAASLTSFVDDGDCSIQPGLDLNAVES